ncbi:V-type ATP synthase subunit C [Desemzia sp. RIT804]|uniref:V-type ATP synthase subunit C n=1 Tax=Desemzia sp. RIT 804 TaxID=2810209 RepID=UPI0019528978|nr:V-type ATP synthase subunit C [Desemzia sp. RIT 804]MBM6613648.1 V-type ATP synthase subunit C [Desemzia sp. RIT 804]
MKDTAFAGSNARIRVYESSLLQNDQFERMLQANSFEEAALVLKDTPYRNDVDELLETRDYDALLTKELQRVYSEMYALSPDPALVELFSLRYTYHNLKVLFKARFTGEDFDSMLIPIGKESISVYRQAVQTGLSEDLNQAYIDSIQEVLTAEEEYHNIQFVDIILDRRYFTHLRWLAEKIGDKKILEFVKYYIDLNNLSTLSRAIKQQKSRNFLITILSSSGNIPKEELVELGKENLESAGKLLSEGQFASIVQASLDAETQELSPVKIDLATDNAIMETMKEAKLQAFGPMPLLAFIHAKETEVKNLRMILAGKENNLPVESVRERMRMNYGS